ncbi:MAG TPA: ABC transporter substrate-binding protein, partial [Firmicutes bacterium]|nr:ABC transporter substrate-binding protein [Bacillota bacterium]
MKKLFALLLAMTMVLGLAACGQTNMPPETSPANESEPNAEETKISGPLVICSSATDSDLAAIEEGFTTLYPDIQIELITCSAGEGIARVKAEAGNPTIDVFYSGLNQADGDRYADLFEQYVSVHDKEMPTEYQSNNGFYNYDH